MKTLNANARSERLLSDCLGACSTGLSGKSNAVTDYEKRLATEYHIRHAIATSSGGAAVSIACNTLNLQPGDSIIVPPTAPICTIHAMQFAGAEPRFCDTKTDSFGLDPEDVLKAFDGHTRAIIEVPMFGYPTDCSDLADVAQQLGIPLIIDAAHAHQVKLNGKWIHQFAGISCFSTHSTKYLSTGEGGFVLTNHDSYAEVMQSYRQFGNFDGKSMGVNFKISGLQAVIGAAALDDLPREVSRRKSNRQQILSRLQNDHLRELPITKGGESSGYYCLVQAINGDATQLKSHQLKHGIPSEIAKYNSKCLYHYSGLAQYRASCPRAEDLLRSLTTIPLDYDAGMFELSDVVDMLNSFRPR